MRQLPASPYPTLARDIPNRRQSVRPKANECFLFFFSSSFSVDISTTCFHTKEKSPRWALWKPPEGTKVGGAKTAQITAETKFWEGETS